LNHPRNYSRTLLSALVLVLAAIIAYLPALKIQFYDGWWYLEWAATMDLPRYLIQFLDPANITQGYRPVQGLYIYLLFQLFHFNPDGYHLAHALLHAANAVLLFLIAARLGKNSRAAFIAALFYATTFVPSLAIFWHAVVDPLAGFFYLATILAWIAYLDTGRQRDWALTFGAYLPALLSKEIAIFLPLILFLIAWWFFGRTPRRADFARYAPFVIAWIPYLYLVYQVQSHGEFVGQFGFQIGPRMFFNIVPYLAVLAFPFTSDLPTQPVFYFWLAITAVTYLGVMLYKKSAALALLGIVAILNVLPLTGFPLEFFNTRYLYLSLILPAIILGWLVDALGRSRRAVGLIASVLIALLIYANGAGVADAAASLAEYTRQLRVPFRDIATQHSSFPDNSLLYFVYSPKTPLIDLQGLFLTRFGTGLKVSGTEDAAPARLRDYARAYVYYFDEQDRAHEILVDRSQAVRATPPPPFAFNLPIRLEGYEVVSSQVSRGEPLVLLLYWRATGKIEKNYTVFVHLENSRGERIAEYDSAPRQGNAPTSQWEINQLVVDALVLSLPADAPRGNAAAYRVRLGWYDAATGERYSVLDANGQPVADGITLEPFSMTE